MSARADKVPDGAEEDGSALEKRTPAEREERLGMARAGSRRRGEAHRRIDRASDTM